MGLVVTPWKRYGHERKYVGLADGPSLGYLDSKTGDVHVGDEADRDQVVTALGIGLAIPAQATEPSPPAAPSQAVEVPPYAVSVDRLARDLASNRAGAGAKQKAEELRAAAPVRTLLARALGVHTDERAWRVGSKGEEIVAGELEKLVKRGWTVVHDVPVGERGSNIDHVLVGPGGAFTVNTKYHVGKKVWVGGDTVMVGGHRQPYIRNARHEAARASKLLSAAYGDAVPVVGLVIILTELDNWSLKAQPADGAVVVGRARTVRKELESLPRRYAVHELDRLALWARRDTTWQP